MNSILSLTILLAATGQILDEPFDRKETLARWERMDGAVTGEGPYSTASIDSGALLLEGAESTRRWLALVRTVPVGDAKWVRISARLRAQDLEPAKARYLNCNLFFRFGVGPLDGTRIVSSDSDWTVIARRVPVPDKESALTIGCFLSIPGRAWFDDVRVDAVEPPDWQTEKTEHYAYRWLPGDVIHDAARKFNEESYRIVSEFLGVRKPAEVVYFKYPNRKTKEEYTADQGNAHRRNQEIHSIWPSDRHEIVHILADGWGDPPALVAEGLAVYLSGGWQGKKISDAARAVHEGGQWIALGDILDTESFRLRPDAVTYAIAGSLVEWLAEEEGKEVLRRLYGALQNRAGAAQNRETFSEAVGLSIEGADARLRAYLGLP